VIGAGGCAVRADAEVSFEAMSGLGASEVRGLLEVLPVAAEVAEGCTEDALKFDRAGAEPCEGPFAVIFESLSLSWVPLMAIFAPLRCDWCRRAAPPPRGATGSCRVGAVAGALQAAGKMAPEVNSSAECSCMSCTSCEDEMGNKVE